MLEERNVGKVIDLNVIGLGVDEQVFSHPFP